MWVLDHGYYTDLTPRNQTLVVKMTELIVLRRPIDPMNNDDLNALLLEAQAFRKAMNIPYFPSECSTPIHMWSPVCSPAK